MRILWDFKCAHQHVFERLVEGDVRVQDCPECGTTAHRLMAAVRPKLDPFSGDFPSASDKWAQDRESNMVRERKHMAAHGEYLNGMPVKP